MNDRRNEDRRAAAERDAAIERALRDVRDRLREALPGEVRPARLPANERPTAPLPDERRETFAANLRAALERALDDPDRPVPVAPESPSAQAPMIGSACAACRGSCCASGGDRAYLYPDHFRLYLRAHPGRTREEVASDYLSRVPAVTVEGSCVYHTDAGCALPREMRANLCNTFLCGDLSALLEGPAPVLAVCFRNRSADPVRAALLDGRGSLSPLCEDRSAQ
jgi:hypothetical protein